MAHARPIVMRHEIFCLDGAPHQTAAEMRIMLHELHWERNGLVVRYSGTVTIAEVLRAQEAYEQDERFDSLRYIVIDTLAVTSANLSPADAEEIWAQDVGAASSNPRIRKAILATLPAVIAFAEAYQRLPRGGFEIRIFDNARDARVWLSHYG